MKILHISSFRMFEAGDNHYATERKLSNGFIRNGHFVYDYPYRNIAKYNNRFQSKRFGIHKMNTHLLKVFSNFKPDIVVLGHAELVKSDTLAQMRKIYPNIRIMGWFVDAVYDAYRIEHILSAQEYFDAIFVTTNPKVVSAFDQSKFYYFPNVVDTSVEVHRNFNKKIFSHDMIFCGASKKSKERDNISHYLSDMLPNMQLRFCGSLGNEGVFGYKYIDLLGVSKMGLNYNKRNDVSMYSSDRIAQLTGNGLLTFSPRIPDFEKIYTENEIVYFDTREELLEKIIYFYQHDDARKMVAENGYLKSHKYYNSTKVTHWMIGILEGKYRSFDDLFSI